MQKRTILLFIIKVTNCILRLIIAYTLNAYLVFHFLEACNRYIIIIIIIVVIFE